MSTSTTSVRPETSSSANPTAPALVYLLDILSSYVDQLHTSHAESYASFLTPAQIASVQALPGSISVLHEVAQYGPYTWIGSVVDVLKETERTLRSTAGSLGRKELLSGREAAELTKEKGKLERRDSAEWVVVHDESEEDSNVAKKAEDKNESLVVVGLRHKDLLALCDVLRVIIPLIPLPAQAVPSITKSDLSIESPATITDFLGNRFLFPKEYTIKDLEALIKSRYSSGTGSAYIQRGQYELIREASWDQPLSTLESLKPNDQILIVPVVDLIPSGTIGSNVRIFNSNSQAPVNLFHTTDVDSPTRIPSLTYKFSDEATLAEDVSSFKYIKVYPMRKLSPANVADDRIYQCKTDGCGTHLTRRFDIISKNFRGQYGKASLFTTLANVTRGPTVTRNMTTGTHTICEVYCRSCGSNIGWLYLTAEATTEQYKVGKFLVEMARVVEIDGDEEEEQEERKEGRMEEKKKVGKGKHDQYNKREQEMDLLSRVRYVQGELGLEDLETRLKALMDEENGHL